MYIAVSEKMRDHNEGAELSSPDLWRGLRNGSKKALARLFEKYYRLLYNYGFNIAPKEELVKDSIQEVFLTVWIHRKTIDQARSVKSYLLCSLRRSLLRKLKKQKACYRRNWTYVKDFFEDTCNVEEVICHFETKSENKRELITALKKLSKRQKEAIYLKFYDGLSNDEIADVMDINRQSVYNHISEAITQLKVYV